MKKNLYYIIVIIAGIFVVSCVSQEEKELLKGEKQKEALDKKVEIKKENDRFVLYRHGKPYYVKGACGWEHLNELKKFGGNSIRTYGEKNTQIILDSAYKNDISVIVGLYVAPLKHGFDYSNKENVRKQYEQIKQQVLELKDHPALLMWGVGNETNLQPDGKPDDQRQLWRAINDIAKMIHEIDPYHPVTTMVSPYKKTIMAVQWYSPEIDVLSFNVFGGMHDLDSKVNTPIIGWPKSYIISEWGANGWWEVEKTVWDAPIESHTTQKAVTYKQNYEAAILSKPSKCLGSYVFYWGQKQEKTSTWFNMFDKNGNISEAVHLMSYYWKKEKMENKPPVINYLSLNHRNPYQNLFIEAETMNEAFISVVDPEQDTLEIEWEIKSESLIEGFWGEGEKDAQVVFNALGKNRTTLTFAAPSKEGPYRLFCNIRDGKGNYATANFPFYLIKE